MTPKQRDDIPACANSTHTTAPRLEGVARRTSWREDFQVHNVLNARSHFENREKRATLATAWGGLDSGVVGLHKGRNLGLDVLGDAPHRFCAGVQLRCGWLIPSTVACAGDLLQLQHVRVNASAM